MKAIYKRIYEAPSVEIDFTDIDCAVCVASTYTEEYDTPEDFVW